MEFIHEIEVAGRPADVIEKLADLPLMASLVPGASVGDMNPDGSYPGTLVVAFGPKRIAFKGTMSNSVDRQALSGTLSGKASADVRGARMAVTMAYRLNGSDGTEPPRTTVRFVSQAQLTGMLAEFAKTGGVVVANAILAEFAQRFSALLAPARPSPAAIEASPEALSLWSLLRVMICAVPGSTRRVVNGWWRR